MNILLTCAGRRNYLVDFFQQALEGKGQVLAGDASLNAPALKQADKSFVLPLVNQANYFDELLQLCQQNQVKLLISLNDLELPLLARHYDRFLKVGTLPLISSIEVIDICFDKWKTFKFLMEHRIPTAKTYLSLAEAKDALQRGEIHFPVVVKPRWGSASIGIEFPEDDEELELSYQLVKKRISRSILAEVSADSPDHCVLIQERLTGQEFGLDVVNDLNASYVTTLARMKLAMRAGETDRAITVEDQELSNLGAMLGKTLGHLGNLDCDVLMGSEGFCILEMNPRFGGGYPFSHMAGANLPAALIAWANGMQADECWLRIQPGVLSAKYDRLISIERRN